MVSKKNKLNSFPRRQRKTSNEPSIKGNIVLIFSLIFLVLFFITFTLMKASFFQKTDDLINSYFSTSSNIFLTKSCLFLAFIFDPLSVIVVSLIIFLFLFFAKFKKDSLFFLGASLFGGALIFLFKELFQRVRPENLYESGFSFPSGHVTSSIVLFCCLVYFSFKYARKNYPYIITAFALFFIFIIAFSRIYLGVHWISDVIGGLFLGGFVVLFSIYLFELRGIFNGHS